MNFLNSITAPTGFIMNFLNSITAPMIILLTLYILIIVTIMKFFVIVPQQQVAIIERFRKFNRTCCAGLNFKIPFIEKVVKKVSTQIEQFDFVISTITKNNIDLKIIASVQLYVDRYKVFDAFYKLSNPSKQIKSYVFDIVRAQIPNMTLDKVYEKKDEIANNIEQSLSKHLSDFGYVVIKGLVTDITPSGLIYEALVKAEAEAERSKLKQ